MNKAVADPCPPNRLRHLMVWVDIPSLNSYNLLVCHEARHPEQIENAIKLVRKIRSNLANDDQQCDK